MKDASERFRAIFNQLTSPAAQAEKISMEIMQGNPAGLERVLFSKNDSSQFREGVTPAHIRAVLDKLPGQEWGEGFARIFCAAGQRDDLRSGVEDADVSRGLEWLTLNASPLLKQVFGVLDKWPESDRRLGAIDSSAAEGVRAGLAARTENDPGLEHILSGIEHILSGFSRQEYLPILVPPRHISCALDRTVARGQFPAAVAMISAISPSMRLMKGVNPEHVAKIAKGLASSPKAPLEALDRLFSAVEEYPELKFAAMKGLKEGLDGLFSRHHLERAGHVLSAIGRRRGMMEDLGDVVTPERLGALVLYQLRAGEFKPLAETFAVASGRPRNEAAAAAQLDAYTRQLIAESDEENSQAWSGP